MQTDLSALFMPRQPAMPEEEAVRGSISTYPFRHLDFHLICLEVTDIWL